MAAPILQYGIDNSASTTYSGSVSDSDTAHPLTSDTNFDAKSGEGMVIMDEATANEEIAYSTGKSGSSLTIPTANRGLEGTTAHAHNAGASIKGILTVGMYNNVIDTLKKWFNQTSGAVAPALGSDADGDTYYRASSVLARLAKGTAGQVLTMNSGATAPEWASPDWRTAGETWVYVGADDPTYQFKVTGVDLTTKYSAGMRVKLTQATGGVKYFIITAVAFSTDTTFTVYGGTDYDLANEAISSPFYSTAKAPAGFPLNIEKWTVRVEDTTDRSKSSHVNGTWYYADLGSINISVPIGAWDLSYQCAFQVNGSASAYGDAQCSLSTANNSIGSNDLTSGAAMQAVIVSGPIYRSSFVSVAAKTPYYLIAASQDTDITLIGFPGSSVCPTVLRARCAYL